MSIIIFQDGIFPTHACKNRIAEKLERLFEAKNNLSLMKN